MYGNASTPVRVELELCSTSVSADRHTGDGAPWRVSTVGLPALDNTTKSASLFDPETGEITLQHDPTLKWQLQSIVRLALPGHRIQTCMRHLRPDRREVQVRESQKSGKAYFAGLMSCGSVWTCPVCAPKIQAVRAQEVKAAIDVWEGSVFLLTQTVPHTRQDALEPLLDAFTLALRKFKGCKGYTNAQKRHFISGSIRALEITDGRNGWHPHAHTIIFCESRHTDLDQLRADLFPLWESAARRAGFTKKLSPQAFDIQDARAVCQYVTKLGTEYEWGAHHELTKAHSKRGHGSSMTPFDMLRSYLDSPDDGRLLARFAEFAYCFHGKRQLVWSDGLKKRLLGTDGLTDCQIAESLGEADPVLARITLEEWRIIRRNDLQAHVLSVVQTFGRTGLTSLLAAYRSG